MQQDLLPPTQTPREALLFSAQMRLPQTTPFAEKKALVEEMLTDLDIIRCADTYIGDEMIRGISGGEKKRTSIGVELVVRPKLIFLDEPTSGLDSYAAHNVVEKLRVLATRSRSCVLCTIHQPSSEAFHTFDKCLLLRVGHKLFFGTISSLSTALAANDFACPAEYNLADHAVYLIQTQSDEILIDLAAKFSKLLTESSDKAKVVDATSSTHLTIKDDGIGAAERAPGFGTQLMALSKREALGWWRDKAGIIASIVIPALLNLIFSCVFFQVGDTTASDYDMQAHFGGITIIAISGMFGAAQPLLIRFPLERGIFLREYATNAYGAVAYFISKMMVEMPKGILNALIVYLVAYFMMALNGNFFFYIITFWASGMAAASTALLVGCLAANAEVANQAGPALFVPQLLFAGFYIPVSNIPAWFSWMQYICSLKYAMNLFILIEFGSATTKDWGPNSQATRAQLQARAAEIVSSNDIYPNDWWVYVLVLIAITSGFRFLALFTLARRAASFF